jgi:hypothetical protein
VHVPIEGLSEYAATLMRDFAPGLQGPGTAVRLARLAALLQERGHRGDAARICSRVLEESSGDGEAALIARTLLGDGVPGWHLPMLHDTARADAYARALSRLVKPGMLVLDAGTGSGLLAVLAARAGAELVIACERDPALAVIAEETMRRNGCDDRVRVIAKNSSALTIGADLPRRADLLVSEVIDSHLLGEGVLDMVAHARAHLLTPEAVAIPESGAIHVAVGDASLTSRPASTVAGVDVSAMEAVRPHTPARRGRPVHLSTDVGTPFRFDLSGRDVPTRGTGACTLRAHRDAANEGLLQWISLNLGAGVELESGPGTMSHAWPLLCVSRPGGISLRAGDTLRVRGEHMRTSVLLWIED